MGGISVSFYGTALGITQNFEIIVVALHGAGISFWFLQMLQHFFHGKKTILGRVGGGAVDFLCLRTGTDAEIVEKPLTQSLINSSGAFGIAGSGQKELCEVISGLVKASKGRIYFEGENIVGKSPRDIICLGIRMGFIPEDRLGMGLVGSMDIVHNLILKDYQNQPGIFLQKKSCIQKADEIVKNLDIQTPDIYTPVKKLSGGNIQKVLLGREIDSAPKVLITAYAVRGLDIGASYKIYDLLNEQKEKGVGVLFVGEDLDVLMDLCDRIMVLCHGEVTGIVDPSKVTKEEIGLLMTGKKREEGDAR